MSPLHLLAHLSNHNHSKINRRIYGFIQMVIKITEREKYVAAHLFRLISMLGYWILYKHLYIFIHRYIFFLFFLEICNSVKKKGEKLR